MAAIIVSILNRKGGVGKTTAVFHLSGYLAKEGYRVLVCDMDPQASLTQGFFGPEIVDSLPKEESIADLFGEDGVSVFPQTLVRPTEIQGLSIILGSEHLNRYNVPDLQGAGLAQLSLRDALAQLREDFDFIFIDSPPNLALCSWSSLVASDFVIVPFQPEDFGCQGMVAIQRTFDAVLVDVNANLRLAGYLLTMVDSRRTLHRAYESLLRTAYGEKVFQARIPDAAAFTEAIPNRQPISFFKPRSAAAKAIREVAEELLHRIETVGARPPEFQSSHEGYKEVA